MSQIAIVAQHLILTEFRSDSCVGIAGGQARKDILWEVDAEALLLNRIKTLEYIG